MRAPDQKRYSSAWDYPLEKALGRYGYMAKDRKSESRQIWLQTLEKHRRDFHAPDSPDYWSTYLDTMSRDQIIAVQNDKLRALTPFLYENSGFYR